MADKTKKSFNWPVFWAVIYTVLACVIVASLVVFYLVSVNNSYTRGLQKGYSQAAAEIKSK